MSKTAAKTEATYARELIRQLLTATSSDERTEILSELIASVREIAAQLED